LATGFFATAFFATGFLATALRATGFLAAALRAAGFFAAALVAAGFLPVLSENLSVPLVATILFSWSSVRLFAVNTDVGTPSVRANFAVVFDCGSRPWRSVFATV